MVRDAAAQIAFFLSMLHENQGGKTKILKTTSWLLRYGGKICHVLLPKTLILKEKNKIKQISKDFVINHCSQKMPTSNKGKAGEIIVILWQFQGIKVR